MFKKLSSALGFDTYSFERSRGSHDVIRAANFPKSGVVVFSPNLGYVNLVDVLERSAVDVVIGHGTDLVFNARTELSSIRLHGRVLYTDLKVVGNVIAPGDDRGEISLGNKLHVGGSCVVHNIVAYIKPVWNSVRVDGTLCVKQQINIDGDLSVGQSLTCSRLLAAGSLHVGEDVRGVNVINVGHDMKVGGSIENCGSMFVGWDLNVGGRLTCAHVAVIGSNATVRQHVRVKEKLVVGELLDVKTGNVYCTELSCGFGLKIDGKYQCTCYAYPVCRNGSFHSPAGFNCSWQNGRRVFLG